MIYFKLSLLALYLSLNFCVEDNALSKTRKEKKTYPLIQNKKKQGFSPDTTVNHKLMIMNSSSIVKNLPTISKASRYNDCVFVLNKTKTQCLALRPSYGGMTNEFNCFDIFYLTDKSIKNDNHYFKIKFDNISYLESSFDLFASESNIKLGLTKDEVINIKGKEFSKTTLNDKLECLIYDLNDMSSTFLSRYNMPMYTSKFYFDKGILIRFTYGFETP